MRISLFRHFLTVFDTFLHYQYAQVHTRELIRTCDIPSASKAFAFPGGEGGCHRQTDEGNRNVRTIISSSTIVSLSRAQPFCRFATFPLVGESPPSPLGRLILCHFGHVEESIFRKKSRQTAAFGCFFITKLRLRTAL